MDLIAASLIIPVTVARDRQPAIYRELDLPGVLCTNLPHDPDGDPADPATGHYHRLVARQGVVWTVRATDAGLVYEIPRQRVDYRAPGPRGGRARWYRRVTIKCELGEGRDHEHTVPILSDNSRTQVGDATDDTLVRGEYLRVFSELEDTFKTVYVNRPVAENKNSELDASMLWKRIPAWGVFKQTLHLIGYYTGVNILNHHYVTEPDLVGDTTGEDQELFSVYRVGLLEGAGLPPARGHCPRYASVKGTVIMRNQPGGDAQPGPSLVRAAPTVPTAAKVWSRRPPGPVWTLALWCFVAAFSVSVLPRVFDSSGKPLAFLMLSAVLELLAGICLIVLGARTPHMALKSIVAAQIVLVLISASLQEYDYGLVTSAFGLIWVGLYSALWFTRTLALSYATASALGYLGIVLTSGHQAPLGYTWSLMCVTMYSIVFGVGYLISQLEQQSKRDSLTGLLNRHALDEYLTMHPTVGRTVSPTTLVAIDLDGFKVINDTQGHAAGDRVLRDFASHLESCLRRDDLVFRVGGDEFLVLLPRTAATNAHAMFERVKADAPIGCSFGAVEWTAGQPFDLATASADQLMYADKASHKPRR